MTAPQAKMIDWQGIAQRLNRDHASSSRVSRVLKAPIRSGMVASMRRFGWSRPVEAPLLWGDHFHGFLPESVTSVIWRTGHYEPLTTRLVIDCLKPGDAFVDIGAHFGYFSLLASRLVGQSGKVVSIEAMPSTFAALKNNVERNGIANIELHNCAAYSKSTTLHFKDYGVVHSSLNTAFAVRGVLEGKDTASSDVAVTAQAADSILAAHQSRKITAIKIDAESSEEFVLEGLTDTLAKHRPMLLMELGGSAADDTVRLGKIAHTLGEAGYQCRRWDNGELVSVVLDSTLPYDNYIWIHTTKMNEHRLGARASIRADRADSAQQSGG
jgi:FkbM family methyltransferase